MESYTSNHDDQQFPPGSGFHLHGPWIYALILNIVQDPDLAHELTLEVFWQARQSARVPGPDQARVWSRVAARRLAITALRSRNWSASHPASFRASCFEAGVNLLEVHRALNSTPRHEREAFELAYFEGLSHSEIAGLTGRSLGTVKTWVRMARIRIERPQSKRMENRSENAAANPGDAERLNSLSAYPPR